MALSIEKKVGIFFLIAIIALGVMIELVEDWRPFETQYSYNTRFDSAVGIKLGDPVRMAGVEVGKIKAINIDEQQVRIDFYVTEGTTIKEDTVAEIRQTNLLGGQFLGLSFGSAASPVLAPGSSVPSRERANIDQLITNFDRNQERVLGELADLVAESRQPFAEAISRFESITRKVDEGTGTLGKIINDPSVYQDLQVGVGDLRKILGRIEKGEGTLGRLLHDPGLYDEASQTLANLRDISGRLREGQGTLGRLLTDESLYDEAQQTLGQIRAIAAKINQGEGTLGLLLNDDGLYQETRQAMERIRSIAAKIDDGQGTVGRLINEDDLYREAKTTLHKVEKTVDGMSDTGPLSALGVVLGTLF
ncbi:ABC transporter substrate-binding protein [Desulfuromonas versatilis]|uniref:ABC transporter substrate-binding protein n=1 Tax=Desulfuromonas versatilis TaxID=2802975 RepID=A0ABM8HV68_9BACT|nr:MlaD family protein [Desulfuromonas versatilis]BCR04967.1 ABC transporter substrate-binding protein [Desulfuromonas versatilis]